MAYQTSGVERAWNGYLRRAGTKPLPTLPWSPARVAGGPQPNCLPVLPMRGRRQPLVATLSAGARGMRNLPALLSLQTFP